MQYEKSIRSFYTTPIFKDLFPVLSEFDQLRFRIIYELSCKYYKYLTFDSEEYRIMEEEILVCFHILYGVKKVL